MFCNLATPLSILGKISILTTLIITIILYWHVCVHACDFLYNHYGVLNFIWLIRRKVEFFVCVHEWSVMPDFLFEIKIFVALHGIQFSHESHMVCLQTGKVLIVSAITIAITSWSLTLKSCATYAHGYTMQEIVQTRCSIKCSWVWPIASRDEVQIFPETGCKKVINITLINNNIVFHKCFFKNNVQLNHKFSLLTC
jgi:hypothetical protein